MTACRPAPGDRLVITDPLDHPDFAAGIVCEVLEVTDNGYVRIRSGGAWSTCPLTCLRPIGHNEILTVARALRVVRWRPWNDEDDHLTRASSAHIAAVVANMRANGYRFSGYRHQGTAVNGVPVLSDGSCLQLSCRSWGDLMAEVDEGRSYVNWAWDGPDDVEEVLP